MLPSPQFEAWNKTAQWSLFVEVKRKMPRSVTAPVNCAALIYREALTGDAVGYYQALADALEEAGIVENDRLIVSWDGSRLLKDAANPRIEVTLTAVADEPQEAQVAHR